jgi:hypothetical protein
LRVALQTAFRTPFAHLSLKLFCRTYFSFCFLALRLAHCLFLPLRSMRPPNRPRSELVIYLGPEREVKRIALAETFAPGSTVTLKVAITVCAGSAFHLSCALPSPQLGASFSIHSLNIINNHPNQTSTHICLHHYLHLIPIFTSDSIHMVRIPPSSVPPTHEYFSRTRPRPHYPATM